ncbi:hypothetical protein H0H92_009575, partial [Tricholoma furcatifolium]
MGRKQEISRLKAQVDSLRRRASGTIEGPLTKILSTPPPQPDTPLPPPDTPLPPPDPPYSPADNGVSVDVNDMAFDDALPGPDCVEDVERSPQLIGTPRSSIAGIQCEDRRENTGEGVCSQSEVQDERHLRGENKRGALSVSRLQDDAWLFEHNCLLRGKEQGSPIQDAFRRGLGYAAQWYDNLQMRVEQEVDAAVLNADVRIQQSQLAASASNDPPKSVPQSTPSLHPGECAWVLQQRCPCCFGGGLFGRPLEREGGDIHVCLDGNFNHRHLRSAGDSPHFYDPSYILLKQFVDDVGAEMEKLRSAPKRRRSKAVVPDEAVDECESSHVAGKGSNVKTNMERYDDGGLMALVCRHDIPIVLANIDTPGEQQKYAVAMLRWLFQLIPPQGTVAVLYDVG